MSLAVALCWSLTVAAAPRVEIVVDGSHAMWGAFDGDRTRLDATRAAVSSLLASLRSDTEAEIGLRILGGGAEWTSAASCLDTASVLPVAPVDPSAFPAAAERLGGAGPRPLVAGLLAAADDLDGDDGTRRIVLVTAGEDECGADPARVVERLRAGAVELRTIGLRLPAEVAARFAAAAPLRPTSTLTELVTALRWSVDDLGLLADTPGTLVVGGAGAPDVEILDAATGAAVESCAAPCRSELAPGLYSLRSGAGAGVEVAGVRVASGRTTELLLDDLVSAPVGLEVVPGEPEAGRAVLVQAWGLDAGAHRVTIVPASAPPGALGAWAEIHGERPEEILVPAVSGAMEARVHRRIDESVEVLLARRPFVARPPSLALTAPEAVEVGTPFPLRVDGATRIGDHVVLVPKGRDGFWSCRDLTLLTGEDIVLTAPAEPGEWRATYVAAETGRPLATIGLEVFKPEAKLAAVPAPVSAGGSFEVAWDGPGGADDFLTVVAPETPAAEYEQWVAAASGNPATLAAPDEPGEWEVRYVAGEGGRVLATTPLTVRPREVQLEVPARVRRGERFDVAWTGPVSTELILTICPEDGPPLRRLDWSATTVGSPISLAAPMEPGVYEVRYVDVADRQVLASRRLRVE